MPAAAAVILAHADAEQVRRLIASLAELDVYLHCDAKTPEHVFSEMTKTTGNRVTLVPRRRMSLSSWSLVDAELAGLSMALKRSRAEHIIVMSGSCYPLVPGDEIKDDLARWRGRSRLELNPLPYDPWGTPRNPDGGLWRFQRRFVHFRDQVVRLHGVPLRTVRRPIPDDLQLHASSMWKIYAREHAAALLRVLDERPDLVQFWRTTLVPCESVAASILRSPALVGSMSDKVCDDLPWYLDWPSPSAPHPRWLGDEHAGKLKAARFAPPRDPAKDQTRNAQRKLFARKLSSRHTAILDFIDDRLRS